MAGHDLVIHLASNPDIAAAMADPAIDFDEGTLITHHVVEAMRRTGVPTIAYASGSGVYGDLGEREADEDHGPLVPVSTYGASKLAGEALISAYAHMFDIRGLVFRFGNVVGRRQTHGVGFDFVRRLREDPSRARGDGRRQPVEELHPGRATSSPPCCGRSTAPAQEPFRRLQRRHRRLHHRARDRRPGARGARARPGAGRGRLRAEQPRLEGRRAGRAPEHRPDPGARLVADRPARPRPCARSMQAMLADLEAPGPALDRGGLPRPRRRADRGVGSSTACRSRRARRREMRILPEAAAGVQSAWPRRASR